MRYILLFFASVFSLANTPADDPIQTLIDEGRDAEAYAMAQSSADAGNARGHEWLGWMYEEGRGVEANLRLAVSHYREAITGGRNHARWRVGVLIDQGEAEGTLEEAVALFEEAARDNFTNAMVSLAVMKATGRGTPTDYPGALEFYMRAARMGNAHGVQGVGVLLMLGQGIDKNPEEAAAWFLTSAMAGNETGRIHFERAIAGMSEEQVRAIIARANDLASEFGVDAASIYESDQGEGGEEPIG
ncbi:MAG: tetratricopeptide repeat protein [Pseudomonadota bacterium]